MITPPKQSLQFLPTVVIYTLSAGANVYMDGNSIYNNGYSAQPEGEGGYVGVALRCAGSGTTLINNTVENNANDGIAVLDSGGYIGLSGNENTILNNGRHGIGLSSIVGGSITAPQISYNRIYSNIRFGIGAYSITNQTPIISQNSIYNNRQSGVGIQAASDFTVQNNFIVSNGLDDYTESGLHYASGIQVKDSTFVNNSVTDNTIRNNLFSGIAVNNTDGYVGPNNTIQYNGNSSAQDCPLLNGPGSGDGGVAVRDLQPSDTLIFSDNVINNNNISTIARKDCVGQVTLDNSDVGCTQGGYWEQSDAIVYIDSFGKVYLNGDTTPYKDTPIIDGNADSTFANITGGSAWGIAVNGGASGVTVRNCNIYGNNPSSNYFGPAGSNMGGGIFVGPNVDAVVYDNDIHDNGYDSAPPEGEGGKAGVVMYCASNTTTFYNNNIYANRGDGFDTRDSSAIFGIAGAGNTIYNNGRVGVGGTGSGNAKIAYNDIYGNSGGVGFYQYSSGSIEIYSNNIHDNSSSARVGGVGIKYLAGGTVNIRSNSITNNTSAFGTNAPAGVGILEPTGGVIKIDNNVIDNNNPPSGSNVGGIGLQGTSGQDGTLDDIFIVSNQITNHGSDDQSGVAFQYMNFTGGIYIRNNTKNGLGIANNGMGIRFKDLPDGMYVRIQGNTIQNNNNGLQQDAGPLAIGFKNCNKLNVTIDNNYMSNNGNTSGTWHKAAIAFTNIWANSSSMIMVARNLMRANQGTAIRFDTFDAYSGEYAKLYIGDPNDSPGTSNDIIEVPDYGKHMALIFKNMGSSGTGGLDLGLYNNQTIDGGIVFKNSKVAKIMAIGNTNITKGEDDDSGGGPEQAAFQVKQMSRPQGMEQNITFINNTISNNPGGFGFIFKNCSEIDNIYLESNYVFSNGNAGFVQKNMNYANSLIFSNNTFEKNNTDTDSNSPGDETNGISMKKLQGNITRFTNNTMINSKCNGIGIMGSQAMTVYVTGGVYYNNGMRGIGISGGSANWVIDGAIAYNNGYWGGSGTVSGSGPSDWVGIGIKGGSSHVVRNCIAYNNRSRGIGANSGTMNVYFSTAVDNADYGIYENGGSITATSSIFWDNGNNSASANKGGGSVTYSIVGGDGGGSNINSDPLFVNQAGENFHITLSSPGKDNAQSAGGVTYDYEGDSRPLDAGYDRGADEYTACSTAGQAVKSSPSNGASNQSTGGVSLNWSAAANATSYDVYFDTDQTSVQNKNAGSKLVTTSALNADTGSLSQNTTYYWRVIAKNSCSTTDDSGEWSFTTGTTCINSDETTKATPTNGASNQSMSGVTLAWNAAANATEYDVYFDTNQTAVQNKNAGSLLVTTSATDTGTGSLSQNTTYYWRVISKNSCGTTDDVTQGEWSFATQTAPPSSCYTYKRQLTINGSVSANYAVLLHFDNGTSPSASAMYNSSASVTKGDDFRIFYDNGGEVEIDRHIAKFTTGTVDIWFKIQADITGSDSASYILYYGKADAANPPADVDNVYYGDGGSGVQQLIAHYDNSNADGVEGETPSTNSSTTWGSIRTEGAIGTTSTSSDLRYTPSVMFGSTQPIAGTIEFWFKPNGWTWDNPGAERWLFSVVDGKFYINAKNGQIVAAIESTATTYTVAKTYSWTGSNAHHIAFSWDFNGGTARLFLDGSQVDSTSISGTCKDNSNNPRIGNKQGGGKYADGYFDEFKTWNFGKTASQLSYESTEPTLSTGAESSGCPTPDTPTPSSPIDGATGLSTTPTLQASAFSGGSGTHQDSQFQVCITSDCSDVSDPQRDYTAGSAVTSWVVSPALNNGTTYFWRVKYQDDNNQWSSWSAMTGSPRGEFTTVAGTPPDTPTPSSPIDGATGQSTTPTLQASAFSGGSGTHQDSQFQVCITSDCSDVSDPQRDYTAGLAVTSWAVSPALNGSTTYFWRVKYQDDNNQWSSWSAMTGSPRGEFVTESAPVPDTPSASSPINNAGGQSLTPTLTASAFSGGSGTQQDSEWQVCPSSACSSPVATESGGATDTHSWTTTLDDSTHYWWQVRYQDDNNQWSSWSSTTNADFTTLTVAPDTPSASSPINNASESTTPTLTASSYSHPASESQQTSEWQVCPSSACSSPVTTESGGATNNHSWGTTLSGGTHYWWRARYQDVDGDWSNWSNTTNADFTTQSSFPSGWHYGIGCDSSHGLTAVDSSVSGMTQTDDCDTGTKSGNGNTNDYWEFSLDGGTAGATVISVKMFGSKQVRFKVYMSDTQGSYGSPAHSVSYVTSVKQGWATWTMDQNNTNVNYIKLVISDDLGNSCQFSEIEVETQ